jgi:hypothetical protein
MPAGVPTGMPTGQAGDVVIPLSRNRSRPPESDEMRAGMPRASSLNEDGTPQGVLIDGPQHVGRRSAPPHFIDGEDYTEVEAEQAHG